MNDTIYRQQAIDTIKTLREVAWGNWHEPTLSPNMVIDALSDLPSAPSRTEEWIPVTKRLPEQKQEVIVTVTRNNGSIFTERDGWTGTGFWGYGHRVIAWMPLPEPFTEDNEDA